MNFSMHTNRFLFSMFSLCFVCFRHALNTLHTLSPHPCILPVVGFCRNFLPPRHASSTPAPATAAPVPDRSFSEGPSELPQPFALSSSSTPVPPPKSPNLSSMVAAASLRKSPNLSPSQPSVQFKKSPQLSPYTVPKSPNKLSPNRRPRSQTDGTPLKMHRAPPVSPAMKPISPAPLSLVNQSSLEKNTPFLSTSVPAIVVPELTGPGSLCDFLRESGGTTCCCTHVVHFGCMPLANNRCSPQPCESISFGEHPIAIVSRTVLGPGA